MEKTTKKVPEKEYGMVTKAGMQKLFKEEASAQPAEISQNMEEANSLGGGFTVVDPIETCLGPIGRFECKPDNFPLHPATCLFGKRRTGKTFTLRDFLYHGFRHIPFGIVLTRTKLNGFWDRYVPPYLVFQDLQKHVLDRLMTRQRTLIKKWKKEHPKETEEDPDAYKKAPELAAFVILDDVISDQIALRYNADLTSLFVEGRHSCISVFICTQYPKGVGPMVRGNCDIAVFQPIFQREQRETLADLYGGWLKRDVFYQLMDDIVVDVNLPGSTAHDPKKQVRTMVCNDFENTLNPQIKFRYYEAVDPGDFRLCDPEYWKESTRLFQSIQPLETIDVIEELESVRWN